MNVKLSARAERTLTEIAARSGRQVDDLVEDAVAGYVAELSAAREVLDTRYDDLTSGRVEPIDGGEARAWLKAKTDAQRRRGA